MNVQVNAWRTLKGDSIGRENAQENAFKRTRTRERATENAQERTRSRELAQENA